MSRPHAALIEAANSTLLVDGDLVAIGEFFSPGYVAHTTGGDLTAGHEVVRKIVGAYRRAFRDFEVEVEILVQARDRLAWQRTIRAIHKASFGGFPATGRPIVWRDMVTSRFQGGFIAEDWVLSDLAEQLLRARKR